MIGLPLNKCIHHLRADQVSNRIRWSECAGIGVGYRKQLLCVLFVFLQMNMCMLPKHGEFNEKMCLFSSVWKAMWHCAALRTGRWWPKPNISRREHSGSMTYHSTITLSRRSENVSLFAVAFLFEIVPIIDTNVPIVHFATKCRHCSPHSNVPNGMGGYFLRQRNPGYASDNVD